MTLATTRLSGRTASRRTLLAASSSAAGLWALSSLPGLGQTDTPLLDPTPSCASGYEATPSTSAGPCFTPDSPRRDDITDGRYPGQELVVGGYILDRTCNPISGELIEVWQADPDGDYDLQGFHLRGHQYSVDNGRWIIWTVTSAPYGPRARHIPLRVQRPGGAVLTTQMFFPDDPTQDRDRQFDARLLPLAFDAKMRQARMDIVLA